jgi:pyruvate dehydrogenase E2 component (dihydrolipoamide acetyltransferase)
MSLEALYPYPVKRISLAGHDCAYIDEGKGGVPMVFLHGFSVNLACFAKIYPHFIKNHRVVALDYPGYYLSEKKEQTYDISFMARSVAELIEKLNLKKAVLVGSSMGGAVAVETALARPDLVGGLVLAAPGGFSGRSVLMSCIVGLQQAIMPRDRVVSAMSARLARRVPTFFADKTNPAIDKILAGYEAMKERKDYSLWIMALVGMARSLLRADLTGRARKITVPALVLWGDRDEVLPPAGAARAKTAMGDWATVIMIPGVGHLPFIEATERFNTEADGFLTTLGL